MKDHAQLDRLARGFAADVARGRVETAELAQRIAAGAKPPNFAQTGHHTRKTLEQIVRDSGFSDAGELDAVLRIDGRAYR